MTNDRQGAIGIFKLRSGELIIARFLCGYNQGLEENQEVVAYHLEKPLVVMQTVTPQGQLGANLQEWLGLSPSCVLQASAVAAVNFHAQPQGLVDAYLQATTGLVMANRIPPVANH